MKYLLDTHILLWASIGRLPDAANIYFADENELYFSSASIWEIVIKHSLHRSDFQIVPTEFYRSLISAGYIELPVTARHAITVETLPDFHKDPFDRIIISQAIAEKIDLVTADEKLAKYHERIIMVFRGK